MTPLARRPPSTARNLSDASRRVPAVQEPLISYGNPSIDTWFQQGLGATRVVNALAARDRDRTRSSAANRGARTASNYCHSDRFGNVRWLIIKLRYNEK